jgi:hypothetical protein
MLVIDDDAASRVRTRGTTVQGDIHVCVLPWRAIHLSSKFVTEQILFATLSHASQ